MKANVIPITLLATLMIGCGESRKERMQRAQRETEEQMHRIRQEQQQQRNIEADCNMRAVEAGVKTLDILTR